MQLRSLILQQMGKLKVSPKNKTIPNSKKIVVFLCITIFLNEYVGNLLISNNEVVIKNIGANNIIILYNSKLVILITQRC